MSELKPRVVASEMEWQITSTLHDSAPGQFLPGEIGSFKKSFHPDIVSSNSMLSNGGRYYKDVGDHLEYATPEDIRLQEGVVANEFAGELLVIDSLARHIKTNEKIQKIILAKRVIDEADNAWGYHINLSADRDAIPRVNDEYLHLYGLHLATSQAMLGAGMIRRDRNGGGQYYFGQKISRVYEDFNGGSTGHSKRPLINTRDEPHTKDPSMRRLHVISTDPHISPWATRMAFGTSSLVLRAIEQGYGDMLRLDAGTYPENTILSRLARTNTADIDMKYKAQYQGGTQYSALEAQKKIIEIVECAEMTEEEAQVLAEWKRAVADMEQDIMLLRDRSDAIAKLALLHAGMKKYDTEDLSHDKLIGIDETYGQLAIISREDIMNGGEIDAAVIHAKSIPHKLRASWFRASMPVEATIQDRILNPPETTRAIVRSRHIMNGADVSWDTAQYPGKKPITMHPLTTAFTQE